jgi:large subunit ribosomal protein L30
MIIAIRIAGMVEIPDRIQAALDHMRLRRKYSAVILEETENNLKLLENVRNFIAYGNISKENMVKLVSLRGQPIDSKKKIDANHVVDSLGKKKFDEMGMKPFFRLHPPRGGIESKKHYGVGKGVLGNNKENINKLLERML